MSAANTAIDVRNLTVGFSHWGQTVRALDSLDLSIPRGQWVMLVGHNGSGKSTLLEAINGRLPSHSGDIRVDDRDISALNPSQIAERIFHVHQDPLLGTAPKLTLFENLMVADHEAAQKKTHKRELYMKYVELLRPVGLDTRLKQLARSLSGGERQLLALLIARLRPSSIMLLDEPLAALDPSKAGLCLEIIRSLSQSGRTVVQVTHDPALAVSGGHRTVLLRHGKVAYDKSGEDRALGELQGLWSSEIDSI